MRAMKSTFDAVRSLAVIFFLSGALAQAATVSGTVTDKTTGKPAAGDAVTLLEPMSGMSEVGHATTDGSGHYALDLPGSSPYLVRVTHEGADYFAAAPQGGGTGNIAVYDVAPKVDGVNIAEHVTGIETNNGQLRVVERYDVHNESAPARTQWSKRSFEVVLPEHAVLGDVSAQRPGSSSLPTSVKLDPDGATGHYSFNFPIQPDADGKGTLFQIEYTLPYDSGKYTFQSAITLPADTVWVVLPKSMSFSGAGFQSSPQDPGVQTFLLKNADPGKALTFTVTGTGSFPRDDQGAQSDSSQGGAAQSGPGGGIGEPINTPDPLSKYKWWILSGLALLLATVAAFLLRRPVTGGTGVPGGTAAAAAAHAAAATPAGKHAALLNALKDELFALESERIAGTLDGKDYAEQKAALETVLKRALKKS